MAIIVTGNEPVASVLGAETKENSTFDASTQLLTKSFAVTSTPRYDLTSFKRSSGALLSVTVSLTSRVPKSPVSSRVFAPTVILLKSVERERIPFRSPISSNILLFSSY